MNVFNIAARELRSLFLSPLSWAVLAVTQAFVAYAFLVKLELFLQLKPHLPGLPGAPGLTAIVVAPALKAAGMVMLLAAPLVTMRLVSEERRSGSLTLLLSAPISMTEIVAGKFLGVMGFFAITVAVIVLTPLSLLAGGTLDFGLLAAGALGLLLLMASFAAVGLFMSTLTAHPAVAAIATFGVLLALWNMDWAGTGAAEGVRPLFTYIAVTSHFNALLQGVVDSADIVYYLLVVASFLALAVRRMDAMRVGN
ncbi:MAG: ABC transporter permease subunit [Gammaproteobacteria bacterium]|nr:ABC transporter permease subunit [Gammaproteobacteria bacterium]NIM72499.1 ABC transporter permease subunit [Gammaproteobacteria bacterium]NIO24258.1 ABC transporter permease subunit [Gammaproteobacteria bacterium]NIO64863.1 ABC transporter permease subunit [Gammaproteobacteria bacterium]NIP44905.1 ABC transporter permease subunit [Gammaproteobacteria bacterium]